MLLSRSDPTVFFARPPSLTLLTTAAALVALSAIKSKSEETFQEAA